MAQTQKATIVAQVQEVVLATSKEFNVDEIAKDVMKSPDISPLPATKEEWEPWRKQISNCLIRMVTGAELIRIQGKKGIYRRTDIPEESFRSEAMPDSQYTFISGTHSEGTEPTWYESTLHHR